MKAVSDVIAPLSGEVVAVNETVVSAPETVNEALGDEPEKINEDPYGDGWLVKVRLTEPSEVEELLEREAYEGSLS